MPRGARQGIDQCLGFAERSASELELRFGICSQLSQHQIVEPLWAEGGERLFVHEEGGCAAYLKRAGVGHVLAYRLVDVCCIHRGASSGDIKTRALRCIPS